MGLSQNSENTLLLFAAALLAGFFGLVAHSYLSNNIVAAGIVLVPVGLLLLWLLYSLFAGGSAPSTSRRDADGAFETSISGRSSSAVGAPERLDTSRRIHLTDGITVIEFENASDEFAWRVTEQLRDLLTAGTRSIIIDLSECREIKAAGLGDLSRAISETRAAGAQIKFIIRSQTILATFERTKLASVVEMYQDEESAVRSFRA